MPTRRAPNRSSCRRSDRATKKIFASLAATLSQNKVAVTVQVDQAQAASGNSTTKVNVLVFFEQEATTPASANPKITPFAYALQMQKVGNSWLVASANPAS